MSDTIVKVLPYRVDLAEPIKKTYLDTLFATQDNEAHRFDITLLRSKAQLRLPSGAAVSAYFIRYSDNATISLTGEANGNVASVTLKKSCYNKSGQFALIIKAMVGDVISTVFYGEGTIFVSSTDTILDEENVVPSLDDLLAQIATMEKATADANTATSKANDAATNADTATANANAATSKANTAAGNANTAAGNANTAAAKIDGMTVSAEESDTADAQISEANGVKHIAFKLPKGNTGATPVITFQVATGAAGTNVLLEQSGTAENPVVKLTIPRGDTGAVDGVDYYEGTPATLGTASPGTANGLARGDHVHPMPSASDVGARPDDWMPSAADVGARPNTWMPSAADVGALASDGTAADASKLGGVAASEYAKMSDIPTDTGSMSMDLLWENASPTSDFEGQTITIDLSEYQYAVFFCCVRTEAQNLAFPMMCAVGGSLVLYTISQGKFVSRSVNTTSNAVEFMGAWYSSTYGVSANTKDNTLLIPYQIFGLKGVDA